MQNSDQGLLAPERSNSEAGGTKMCKHADDLRLAEAVRGGEAEATRLLVARLERFLTQAAPRGSPQEREELVSDTLTEVVMRIAAYQGESRLEDWAKGIQRNLWRKRLRQRYRRKSVYEAAGQEAGFTANSAVAGQDAVAEADEISQLEQIILEMPEIWKDAWHWHSHGQSYGEIARTLDAPQKTVERWLHEARRWLTAQYLKVSRGAVEATLELGLDLAQKGKMPSAWEKYRLAAEGLSERKEADWVWRLRAEAWYRLGWIAVSMPERPREEVLTWVGSATRANLTMFDNPEQAVVTESVELTLRNRRNELQESRRAWERIGRLAESGRLGIAGQIKAAEADFLLGLIEGRLGLSSLDRATGLVSNGVEKLKHLGAEVEYGVGLLRLAELLLIGRELDQAEKLMSEAENAIPEGFKTAKALLWYTRHLSSLLGRRDSLAEQQSATLVRQYAGAWDIGSYIRGIERRERLRETWEGRIETEDGIRRLIRPER